MSTKYGPMPNLINVTKALDPDGKYAEIGKLLSQTTPMLNDIPIKEGNQPHGEQITVETSLPKPVARMLNRGTTGSKSNTEQVTEGMMMLQDWFNVDSQIAKINGMKKQFMSMQIQPFFRGFAIESEKRFLYGNDVTDPASILGIAPRYDSLTFNAAGVPTGKPNALVNSAFLPNIVDFGGTGANLTSIYAIAWGFDSIYGIYPKGSKAGLEHKDLGEMVLQDDTGKEFMGYKHHFQQHLGLAVKDWRCCARLANIKIDTLLNSQAEKEKLALHVNRLRLAIPQYKRGSVVLYMAPIVRAALEEGATNAGSRVMRATKDAFGTDIYDFRGTSLRECASILEQEAHVA